MLVLLASANVVRTTLADANRTRITSTYCVYTMLRYSWWWTVNMSETCRLLYQINVRNRASRWFSLQEHVMSVGVFPKAVRCASMLVVSTSHIRVNLYVTFHTLTHHHARALAGPSNCSNWCCINLCIATRFGHVYKT